VGKTKRGKGTKIMAVAEGHGLPIAVCTESATPHEVTLVQQTLAEIFVQEPVQRLIGDNAYDSDRLDRELSETRSVYLDDRAPMFDTVPLAGQGSEK
jgi:hypothetical protein